MKKFALLLGFVSFLTLTACSSTKAIDKEIKKHQIEDNKILYEEFKAKKAEEELKEEINR